MRGGMRELRERSIHLCQRTAERSQQLAIVPFDFRQTDAINPCQQANEVLMPICTLDLGNRISRFGLHDPRELQVKVAGCKKLNKLILKLKELETFLGVGNLQDKLFT